MDHKLETKSRPTAKGLNVSVDGHWILGLHGSSPAPCASSDGHNFRPKNSTRSSSISPDF